MTDLLQPQADPPIQEIDPDKNYFSELVGEGKKYKDQEALAKANVHGTQTIDLMKKRLDDLTEDYKRLREDNVTKAKLEDLINQISAQSSSSNTPAKEENNQPPAIDLTKIEELVENKLSVAKQMEKDQANLSLVQSKLIDRFGPNYQNQIKTQIEAIGLTPDDFHALAKKSPAALFRTLGMDTPQQQETFQAPLRTTQRSDSFAPVGATKRTWSYYQNLKKEDPQAYYYDRNIAIQMQKDAIELGETFRDGDYYRKGLHEN